MSAKSIVLLTLSLCALSFFLGRSWKIEPEIQVFEKKIEHQISNRTKKTTTKPDGTITVVEREKTTTKVEERTETVTSNQKTKYRVGILVEPDVLSLTPTLSYTAMAGARLGDLPLWVDIGYSFKHKAVLAGVSLEW